ncbi:hypothetical protein LOC67_21790 [Stieleria sp. JC731]|uniref:glycosyltransferase n=1 Tax=Pirellulaceae TaxID=2691357 RepID=UPI001E49F3B5|nr:hypothetical protein [Stieleria sp. JC731]MCC9603190.1 hypothetical protein [Stieleria sp. JC731]
MKAKILYAWEWGTGLGHLARFIELAERLVADGHQVTVAARDVSTAARLVGTKDIEIIQSPISDSVSMTRYQNPSTMAALAWNLGYCNGTRVEGLVTAWYTLAKLCRPEVVISDFGIGAAIAARMLGCRHVRIGTGFECPPRSSSLTPLRFHTDCDMDAEKSFDARISQWIKVAAKEKGREINLSSLSELNENPSSTFLATVPELDHYDRKAGSNEYLGIWDQIPATPIQWPDFGGKKAFAYLKRHPSLPTVLSSLSRCGLTTALVTDGEIKRSQLPRNGSVAIQPSGVDLDEVADECCFAITNANHGTTLGLLARGVPVLTIPLFIEQRITALRMEQLNLGRRLPIDSSERCCLALTTKLNQNKSIDEVEFADRYFELFGAQAASRAYDRLSDLLQNEHS